MNAVENIHYKEPVRLDRDQLEVLMVQLGPSGADKLVNQSLEDLAVGLSHLHKRVAAGQTEAAQKEMRNLISIGQQLGMTTLARVARDALDLSRTSDAIALHAVLARLGRIGEASLIAVWDLQDMSV